MPENNLAFPEITSTVSQDNSIIPQTPTYTVGCFKNIPYSFVEPEPYGPYLDAVAELSIYSMFEIEDFTDKTRIDFNDDTWDFNPYARPNISPNSANVVHFENFPEKYRSSAKLWIFFKMRNGVKASTLNGYCSKLVNVFKSLSEDYPGLDISTYTANEVFSYFASNPQSSGSRAVKTRNIMEYYSFAEEYCGLHHCMDLKKLHEYYVDACYSNAITMEQHKESNIPGEYFDAIVCKGIASMTDKTLETDKRMVAAMTILLSQTGLRVSDLVELKVSDLTTKHIPAQGVDSHFLRYTCNKNSRDTGAKRTFDIFINNLAYQAFMIIKELRNESELSKNSPYLYAPVKGVEILPVNTGTFNNRYRRFIIDNLPNYIYKDWEGIKKGKHNTNTLVSIPNPRKFRVNFCTCIYKKGVSLAYIQEFMGHVYEEMRGYYARVRDESLKNHEKAEEVIRQICTDGEDVHLLGGDGFGEEIRQRISEFLRKKNVNVYEDFDELVKKLEGYLEIRVKQGGICIKHCRIPCSEDENTNKILCAFNQCPNLFYTFYMIDSTYLTYTELKRSIEYNASKHYRLFAEKELDKLKKLITNKFRPQLEELESEIERKGVEYIKATYPELLEIIENLDEIKQEVTVWMNK